eukprot:305747-Pleurochrysis_carterae.AAC.1
MAAAALHARCALHVRAQCVSECVSVCDSVCVCAVGVRRRWMAGARAARERALGRNRDGGAGGRRRCYQAKRS